MSTLQGDRAPTPFAAFPTLPTNFLEMSAAMRSPMAWAAPFWSFYAAAAQSSMALWSAALSMKPAAMEQALAGVQQTMAKPMEALVAPLAELEPIEAVIEMPARVETAGEPEPAMVGGEAAPVSPMIAVEPKA